MKLAPGTPLAIGLWSAETTPTMPVGVLAMADGLAQLQWSQAALAAGLPVDPLLYPLEPGLLAARTKNFDGLHGFLADSLPDAWGMMLLQRRLARLGHSLADLSAADRLALVGRQGRGALVYAPASMPAATTGAIDLGALAAESDLVLRGAATTELSDILVTLGSASGGARPKVHICLAANGEAHAEEGAASADATSWIVKFRAPQDPVDIGPVEEAYARMARAAGIVMADTQLLATAQGPGYFASRRFDRPVGGRRVHMVSLAGAVEAAAHLPSLDYDGFLRATLAITRHAADVEQVFRRMIFNILAHNRDDHTRQHAYLMSDTGLWRLAPAYDLTFSSGPGGEHYLAIANEGRSPTRDHVAQLGKQHGVSARVMTSAIEQTRAALASWPRQCSDLGISATTRDDIGAALSRVDAGFN